MGDEKDKLLDKAKEKAWKAGEKATEPKLKDGKWVWLAKFFKRRAEGSAYEHIDGYVSRPEGRDDVDIRVEARSLSGALPSALKGKLVDSLVEGAKAKREKAAKQRAEGREDLAVRTEAQARGLEVAADEINKNLPKELQRDVKIADPPEAAPSPPKEEEEEPHPADPRRRIRGRPLLLPLGALALAGLLAIGFVALSGDDDPDEASAGGGEGLELSAGTSGRLPIERAEVSYADLGATYWEGELIVAPYYEVGDGTDILLIRINAAQLDPAAREPDEAVDLVSDEDPCGIPDIPPACDAWDYPYQNVFEMQASFDSGDTETLEVASEASAAYEFEIPAGATRLTGLELGFVKGHVNWLRDKDGFYDPQEEDLAVTWSAEDLAASEPAPQA